MTEAPERIWVRQTSGWGGLQRGVCQNSEMDGHEYVRADLARPVTVAEAAKVLTEDGFFEPAVAITESLRNAGYIVPMTRVRTALRALSQKT